MPPRKPKHLQKSHAETTAENYFPVDETMIKRAVEKTIIPLNENPEKIEILSLQKNVISKKRKKKSKESKKSSVKKVSKQFVEKSWAPEEITLKKDGYELVITEKPQAALKISSALGKSVKRDFHGIPYYEVSRDGKKIIVACAVGHLFTLKQMSGKGFPVFDIKWVPNFIAKKNDFTKKYYDTILKLSRDAGSVTVATDYDVEGEVIGMNVVRFICGQTDANRMKFSTLTEKELNESYENKSNAINWPSAFAGETRHYLDWFYGINLSRALMNAVKAAGAFKIMSIGRIQGPALKLVVDKEKEIQSFKSEKYWQVFIKIKNSHEMELKHNKDVFKKSELEKFNELKGKIADCVTEKKSQELPPNPPFDLTSLQIEAYRIFSMSPSRSLQVAQSLYLSGLISYPRTSSQKLPDSISYRDILEKIAKRYKAEKLIKRGFPVEGNKTDPAHPSIHPTGQFENINSLSDDEIKLYDLIAKRFIALFCEPAILDKKTIKVEVNGLKFSDSGTSVRKKSWLEIYPVKIAEKELPDISGKVKIFSVRNEEKETLPPKRYTQASIISELEKRGLGTKATRTSILETLYDRGYIKEKSVEATPLGISLVETLEKNSPIITDEKLTRNFEEEMEKISESTSGFKEKEEMVISKAVDAIKKISEEFREHEGEIGRSLLKANAEFVEQLKEQNKLCQCHVCNLGFLAITYSKKTRRFFIACNAYPKCKNTYSLPPNSLIKKANKICEKCNFPMLLSIRKGKRPWIFCFNRDCETNKERLEEYRKKKENEMREEGQNNPIKSSSEEELKK